MDAKKHVHNSYVSGNFLFLENLLTLSFRSFFFFTVLFLRCSCRTKQTGLLRWITKKWLKRRLYTEKQITTIFIHYLFFGVLLNYSQIQSLCVCVRYRER